jgi:hypothetical protein
LAPPREYIEVPFHQIEKEVNVRMRTCPDLFQAISEAIGADEYARIPPPVEKAPRRKTTHGEPRRDGYMPRIPLQAYEMTEDIFHTLELDSPRHPDRDSRNG